MKTGGRLTRRTSRPKMARPAPEAVAFTVKLVEQTDPRADERWATALEILLAAGRVSEEAAS